MKVYYMDINGKFVGEGDSAKLPSNATDKKPNTHIDIWDSEKQQWVTPKKPKKTKEEIRKEKLKMYLNRNKKAIINAMLIGNQNNIKNLQLQRKKILKALKEA